MTTYPGFERNQRPFRCDFGARHNLDAWGKGRRAVG